MIKMSPGKSFAKHLQLPTPIPEHVTNGFGIPPMVLSLLENAETLSQMKDLIAYSQQNPHLGPAQALTALVQIQQQAAQQHIAAQQQAAQMQAQGLQPNGPMPRTVMPVGPGGPGMPHGPNQQPGGMPMSNSPSVNDIRMGNVLSPHVVGATPSPAQNHMQAPGMVAQHSQHHTSNPSSQTSTTVGSANTSPNQTNKRRRASTTSNVKIEGEDGNGDGGGGAMTTGPAAQKIKQSPRGANKRTKLSS